MKQLLKFKKALFIIGLVIIAFVPLAFKSNSYFEISKNLDIFASLFKELNTYYVDEVEPSKLMRTGIEAMLESLDPYTNYISEADIEGYRLQTTGKYGGIGAIIRQAGDFVVVAEPYAGYPADKAGLLPGDKLLEIEGKAAKNKTTEEISQMLKGQPGTPVNVKVSRLMVDGADKVFNVDIVREEIKINNVPFYGMVEDGIGYIRLSNFTENAGKEVQNALQELKSKNQLAGVILDVRGNPGGLLNEAVNVSNVFIDKGQEIVSTKGKIEEWDKAFKTLNNAVDTDIPLVVLANSGSASASEIVAGSIQDMDRGIVVGQRTFGKGLVQTTRSLSYNTKLKVTTAKYYIPSGRCIQAINYAERDEDGSVKKIPDSLKVAFQTKGGRLVYDGAGIAPDVELEKQKLSKIAGSLLTKNHIFDYATRYRTKHDKIAPAKSFRLTDADYAEFMAFLKDKEYDYTTKSEELISELKETIEEEKYYSEISDEMELLEQKMQHSKEKDLLTHKDEIKSLLEQEIVGRYYYREGMIEASFRTDDDIQAAVEVIENKNKYHALLTPAPGSGK